MNHIKYRERTEQDNINSIKNIKINPERKDKTIICLLYTSPSPRDS